MSSKSLEGSQVSPDAPDQSGMEVSRRAFVTSGLAAALGFASAPAFAKGGAERAPDVAAEKERMAALVQRVLTRFRRESPKSNNKMRLLLDTLKQEPELYGKRYSEILHDMMKAGYFVNYRFEAMGGQPIIPVVNTIHTDITQMSGIQAYYPRLSGDIVTSVINDQQFRPSGHNNDIGTIVLNQSHLVRDVARMTSMMPPDWRPGFDVATYTKLIIENEAWDIVKNNITNRDQGEYSEQVPVMQTGLENDSFQPNFFQISEFMSDVVNAISDLRSIVRILSNTLTTLKTDNDGTVIVTTDDFLPNYDYSHRFLFSLLRITLKTHGVSIDRILLPRLPEFQREYAAYEKAKKTDPAKAGKHRFNTLRADLSVQILSHLTASDIKAMRQAYYQQGLICLEAFHKIPKGNLFGGK